MYDCPSGSEMGKIDPSTKVRWNSTKRAWFLQTAYDSPVMRPSTLKEIGGFSCSLKICRQCVRKGSSGSNNALDWMPKATFFITSSVIPWKTLKSSGASGVINWENERRKSLWPCHFLLLWIYSLYLLNKSLTVKSLEVSKPRHMDEEWPNRSEIW